MQEQSPETTEYHYTYQEDDAEIESQGGFLCDLLECMVQLAVIAVVIWGINTFLIQLSRVEGTSMRDTLNHRMMVVVDRLVYHVSDPAYGDVVLCHYPGYGKRFFGKRVIGLPGDVLEIRDNVLYRNGYRVDEPYLNPALNRDGYDMAPFALGEDEYFVAGDNRDDSHDCRNYYVGQVGDFPCALTRDMIVGRIYLILSPFSRLGWVK
ncbi:MAG: signal peptidase I [Clostridiales bacterium]|nr:signal peptidase I [Clostridiales bacterium]